MGLFTVGNPAASSAVTASPDFITLSCPSCGGGLQLTDDIERFACAHCGQQHIVRRQGGTVSLSPVLRELGRIHAGVDKAASELAIVRIKEEIVALEQEKGKLIGKAAVGQTITAWAAIVSAFCLLAGFCAGRSFLLWFTIGGIAFVVTIVMLVIQLAKNDGTSRIDLMIERKEQELAEHLRQVSQ
jgi:predicted RNA-binding Zn-ribbon protein involved in translation (DUF1610 family)